MLLKIKNFCKRWGAKVVEVAKSFASGCKIIAKHTCEIAKDVWKKASQFAERVIINVETWVTTKAGERTITTLSFSWGLLMTVIGAIVVGIFKLAKKKIEKHGPCYIVTVGKSWGGINLGYFSIVSGNSGVHTKNHELGHALQNCILGPFMPIVVGIPSLIRAGYRTLLYKMGKPVKTEYDDIWFEGSATRLGDAYMENHPK